jgi:hypothetical protein
LKLKIFQLSSIAFGVQRGIVEIMNIIKKKKKEKKKGQMFDY